MVLMTEILCSYCVETHWDSGARVILRVAVTAVTAVASSGLTWSVVYVVVLGWTFGSVGCHEMSKGAELSCELDYTILFWLWILSGIYPLFVENIRILWKYPRSVDIIRILSVLSLKVYSSSESDWYNISIHAKPQTETTIPLVTSE